MVFALASQRGLGRLPTGAGDPSPTQHPGSFGADHLAAEVDVQGHRPVGVAELVGALARGEAGIAQSGGDRLAEAV